MPSEDFDALLDRGVPEAVEVEDPGCSSPVAGGSGCVVVLAQVGGEGRGELGVGAVVGGLFGTEVKTAGREGLVYGFSKVMRVRRTRGDTSPRH